METKYPSFKSYLGRDPEPYQDYDPNEFMCQDDYEFFSGTGRYSDDVPAPTEHDDAVKLIAQGYTFCAGCGQLSPNLFCSDCRDKHTPDELDALWKEYCENMREEDEGPW